MAYKIKKLAVGPAERTWLAGVLNGGKATDPSAEDLASLLPSLTLYSYSSGAPIFEEGDHGSDLYFLYKGAATVKKSRAIILKKEIGTLKPGEFFGEIGFLVQTPRSASIVAKGEATAFKVSPSEFQKLLEKYPLLSAKMEETARARMQQLAQS